MEEVKLVEVDEVEEYEVENILKNVKKAVAEFEERLEVKVRK